MSRRSAHLLVFSVGVLLVVGLVMLFSASAYQPDNRGDAFHFLKRQSVWLGLGLIACLVASRLDYHWWFRLRWPLFAVTVVALGLCFVPGIGGRINGSHRWIHFGPIGFQPSDLAKLTLVLVLAGWATRWEHRSREFWFGLALPGLVAGVLLGGILAEPDLGTTVLLGAVTAALLFVAGCRIVYLLLPALGGGAAMYWLASSMGNRRGRILAFMDLEKYKQTFGHQQWEGLQAFATGGVTGQGLGESVQKMRYLPYAHTDFILPIVGEELGLRVTLLVVGAFGLIAVSGVLIARAARDRFGLLLAFGLTMTIVLQAAVNIGVTTALLPNKGMPLPFISSGGSNLCLCLLFVGILLNVHRQGGRVLGPEVDPLDPARRTGNAAPRVPVPVAAAAAAAAREEARSRPGRRRPALAAAVRLSARIVGGGSTPVAPATKRLPARRVSPL